VDYQKRDRRFGGLGTAAANDNEWVEVAGSLAR
jgi:hypothetical protein